MKQVEHYSDYDKRLVIAKKFIDATSYNIYRNVRYYNGRGINLERVLNEISSLRGKLNRTKNIEELMGIEGNIRKKYYESWNDIIKQNINFTKRVKNPPENMINTLLSFANSLVYTTALADIYKTH